MQNYVLAKDPNQTTVTNAVQKDRIRHTQTLEALMAACSERNVRILKQPRSRECLLLAVKGIPELDPDLEGIVRVVTSSERVQERSRALTRESAVTVISRVGEALHDCHLATKNRGDGGGNTGAAAAATTRYGVEEVEESS